jgi:hypothetical protein
MPRISLTEGQEKREAALDALRKPTIPANRQALVDAKEREAKRHEAASRTVDTAAIDPDELPEGWVLARVLRRGDNKIYTGQTDATQHVGEEKFTRYRFGEIVALEGHIARAQEENGNVEVQDAFRATLGLPQVLVQ